MLDVVLQACFNQLITVFDAYHCITALCLCFDMAKISWLLILAMPNLCTKWKVVPNGSFLHHYWRFVSLFSVRYHSRLWCSLC